MQFNLISLTVFFIASQAVSACAKLGDTSIFNCGGDGDIVRIDHASVSPNPPRKGEPITITMDGVIKDTINYGSSVWYKASYNGSPLGEQNRDLCQSLNEKNAPVRCPIGPQPFHHSETFNLPPNVPSGEYKLESVAQQNGRQIFNVFSMVRI